MRKDAGQDGAVQRVLIPRAPRAKCISTVFRSHSRMVSVQSRVERCKEAVARAVHRDKDASVAEWATRWSAAGDGRASVSRAFEAWVARQRRGDAFGQFAGRPEEVVFVAGHVEGE
jgi:hypothetical protein